MNTTIRSIDSYRWRRILAISVVAILPSFIMFLMITFHLNSRITNFLPNYWNDQVAYWHQIYSFSQVGFETGYYAFDEMPSPNSRFGAQGPAYPLVMGTMAHFTGWYHYSSVYYNMVFIALGVIFLCTVGQLNSWQILLVGMVVSTSWLILICMPTVAQESLHHLAAFIFAGLIGRLLTTSLPRSLWIGGFILLLVLSFVRFSWVLLLIPYLSLRFQPRTRKSWLVILAIAVAITVFVMMVVSRLSAPGGNVILATFAALGQDPQGSISQLAATTIENVKAMFNPLSTFLGVGIGPNLQIIGLLVVFVLAWLPIQRRWRIDPTYSFHVYNLGTIFAASLVLYLPGGYWRVIGVHVLLSLLVLIKQGKFRIIYVMIGTNLLLISTLFTAYDRWLTNFNLDIAELERDGARFQQHVVYEPNPLSPWCNTVFLSADLYDRYVTAFIPAGIGVSVIINRDVIDFSLESKYLLLTDEEYEWVDRNGAQTELLETFREGNLYLNLDSDCLAADNADSGASA